MAYERGIRGVAVGCGKRMPACCGAQRGFMDVLVRGTIGVESEDLENKTWWPEIGEKRELFFVLSSSEESAVGVDERLAGDIIEAGGQANGEMEVAA